ncbi:hypothetical protein Taro_014478 [Colocasia esculenta]|uniref:Uncharacterized protein n=1 Tax=Colocasia esculenta TaxID=4460 RepID=A0A843UEX1_COLES|nr:hypothetical protein [Colocasia esculenta]
MRAVSGPVGLASNLVLPCRSSEVRKGLRHRQGRPAGTTMRATPTTAPLAASAASPATLLLLLLLLASASESALALNSAAAFVQNAVYSNRIAIFSKSYCPNYILRGAIDNVSQVQLWKASTSFLLSSFNLLVTSGHTSSLVSSLVARLQPLKSWLFEHPCSLP